MEKTTKPDEGAGEAGASPSTDVMDSLIKMQEEICRTGGRPAFVVVDGVELDIRIPGAS